MNLWITYDVKFIAGLTSDIAVIEEISAPCRKFIFNGPLSRGSAPMLTDHVK